MKIKNKIILHTNGKGLWTTKAKGVVITRFKIMIAEFTDGYNPIGDLWVYFDTSSWDVNHDGLIYTDPLWIKELRQNLLEFGFSHKAINEVGYSEQGMQGDDYVSLDVGSTFTSECDPLFRFIKNKEQLDGTIFELIRYSH